MSAFDEARFATSYPVSFIMRSHQEENWFRFHSLPKSKRYPEGDFDWSTLLDRHREVSDTVLGHGSKCRVHLSRFIEEPCPPAKLEPVLPWSDLKKRTHEGEDVYCRMAETSWNFDTFVPWLRLIAEGEMGWISFHSLTTDSMYCPYDGGADIFSLDSELLSKWRDQFSKWASAHPSGL